MNCFDLIIIGAGPGGYRAAEYAAKQGLKVVIFEGENVGGTCLNVGCIPTKTLLYSAKILDYAHHGEAYGVTVTGASIDHAKVVDRKDKVVKTLVSGVGAKMRGAGVTVIPASAKIAGDENGATRLFMTDVTVDPWQDNSPGMAHLATYSVPVAALAVKEEKEEERTRRGQPDSGEPRRRAKDLPTWALVRNVLVARRYPPVTETERARLARHAAASEQAAYDLAHPEEAAVKALTDIRGVGIKVASCTALFGLHLLDAFPVDVWIRRVLEREYPLGYPLERYQPYNGVYQQYMFYYCRNVVPDQYSL